MGRTSDVFLLISLLRDFFSASKWGEIYVDVIKTVIEQLENIKKIVVELGSTIKRNQISKLEYLT